MKKTMMVLILITFGTTAFAGNSLKKAAKEYCSQEYKSILKNKLYIQELIENGAVAEEEGAARLEIQRLALKNVDLTCAELLGERKNFR